MSQLNATEWIWRNGEFVRWDDARVHVLAHSMQYGSSVFEGIRCYETDRGPAIFRLREHLERLLGSCKIYRMEVPYSLDQLLAACTELVEKNAVSACYIRPMVLRGYGAASMVPFASPVEVFLPCWPWGAYLGDEALEQGVDVCVSSWNRVAPNTLPSMAKMAGNYLSGMLTKMEALADGYAEAIALAPDGTIGEGSGQNVFVVRHGILHTPPINGSILHGITRDAVLTLARDAGIPVRSETLPRELLYLAEEVFFCGTAAEVTPVRSVDRIPVGTGKPGPITRKIQALFQDTVHGRTADPRGWLTMVRGAAEPALARKGGVAASRSA
jgi:branched-chain amino acid aminotransferase